MGDNGGGEHLKILGAKGYARLMPKIQKFMKKCNTFIEEV